MSVITRVYVDIVGDLFHYGHVGFLQKARALGDVLVVGVCSDGLVRSYKRKPIMTLQERVAVIQGCRYVDEVIPNCVCPITREFIEHHRLDLVVHGDDYSAEEINHWYGAACQLGIFRPVPYTWGISTSELIERVLDRYRPNTP